MGLWEKLDVSILFLSQLFDCTRTLKPCFKETAKPMFLSLNLLFSHGLPKFQKHFQGPEITKDTVECNILL